MNIKDQELGNPVGITGEVETVGSVLANEETMSKYFTLPPPEKREEDRTIKVEKKGEELYKKDMALKERKIEMKELTLRLLINNSTTSTINSKN